MKRLLILIIMIWPLLGRGQLIHLADGDYIDTTGKTNADCNKNMGAYYYQVGGKYPEASYTLVSSARSFFAEKLYHKTNSSGYLTFQFLIDCQGRLIKNVKVLQTDPNYHKCSFDSVLIKSYYEFLLTLNNWKIARSKNGETFSYYAFMTFKIKDGTIENIIP
jgi:hypothetical protein